MVEAFEQDVKEFEQTRGMDLAQVAILDSMVVVFYNSIVSQRQM